jgi:L-threonylcarbamoyladenylate synthase
MKNLKVDDIQEIIQLLKEGAVIAYPTETSYAIGCDATNTNAVAKVFAIKNRPTGKGTPIIIPNSHNPEQYILLSSEAQRLAEKHWPGALNIIGHRQPKSQVSKLCETGGTQSIRKSSSSVASQLATLLNRPLVATSANKSGEQAIYDPAIIQQQFGDSDLAAIIDVGVLPITPASTTIDCTSDVGEIVRQGGLQI